MSYVEEAKKLVKDNAGLTISNFERLIWLREQAKGQEAALIGKMVESFIMQAPPDVLKHIVRIV